MPYSAGIDVEYSVHNVEMKRSKRKKNVIVIDKLEQPSIYFTPDNNNNAHTTVKNTAPSKPTLINPPKGAPDDKLTSSVKKASANRIAASALPERVVHISKAEPPSIAVEWDFSSSCPNRDMLRLQQDVEMAREMKASSLTSPRLQESKHNKSIRTRDRPMSGTNGPIVVQAAVQAEDRVDWNVNTKLIDVFERAKPNPPNSQEKMSPQTLHRSFRLKQEDTEGFVKSGTTSSNQTAAWSALEGAKQRRK